MVRVVGVLGKNVVQSIVAVGCVAVSSQSCIVEMGYKLNRWTTRAVMVKCELVSAKVRFERIDATAALNVTTNTAH